MTGFITKPLRIFDEILAQWADIILIDTDPTAGAGVASDIGSLAIGQDGLGNGVAYSKFGAANTDWIDLSATSIDTDTRTATVVVGNQVAGDTANDCDYLHTGAASTAIQDAITAVLAAGGGLVHIKRGDYTINADLTIADPKKGIVIQGEGATRIIRTTPTNALINITAFSPALSDGSNFVKLRDLMFSGDGVMVRLVDGENFVVTGCTFQSNSATSITAIELGRTVLTEDSKGVIIINDNRFGYVMDTNAINNGIVIKAGVNAMNNLIIQNNQFYLRGNGIGLWLDDTSILAHSLIEGNYFSHITPSQNALCFYFNDNTTLQNNVIFRDNQSRNIAFLYSDSQYIYRTAFINNSDHNQSDNSHIMFDFSPNASGEMIDVLFFGNNFENENGGGSTSYFCRIAASENNIERLQFLNNKHHQNFTSHFVDIGNSGVAGYIRNVQIYNNQVSGSNTISKYVRISGFDIQNISINDNNFIAGCTSNGIELQSTSPSDTYGINISGNKFGVSGSLPLFLLNAPLIGFVMRDNIGADVDHVMIGTSIENGLIEGNTFVASAAPANYMIDIYMNNTRFISNTIIGVGGHLAELYLAFGTANDKSTFAFNRFGAAATDNIIIGGASNHRIIYNRLPQGVSDLSGGAVFYGEVAPSVYPSTNYA